MCHANCSYSGEEMEGFLENWAKNWRGREMVWNWRRRKREGKPRNWWKKWKPLMVEERIVLKLSLVFVYPTLGNGPSSSQWDGLFRYSFHEILYRLWGCPLLSIRLLFHSNDINVPEIFSSYLSSPFLVNCG